jgi:hypothetical protein
MKKNSWKFCAALLVAIGLTFGNYVFAQETPTKVKLTPEKNKVNDEKVKYDKDEHDHSKGGLVTNGVGTGVKQTGKTTGKGIKKVGKGVGKAASAVTEPVH